MRTSRRSLSVKKVRYAMLCVLCCLLCGCATMFSRGADEITIISEPEGARVFEGANLLGTTPMKRTFARDSFENTELTVKMEGRISQKIYLTKALDKKSLLNFGFITTSMGATSWGIDLLSGHMMKYSPDSYLVILEKEGAAGNKEQSFRQRLRFVMVNQECLKKDIAQGRGECLGAYYEIGLSERPSDHYQDFLDRVSGQAGPLLAVADPLEFHRRLERALHNLSLSYNGARQDRP